VAVREGSGGGGVVITGTSNLSSEREASLSETTREQTNKRTTNLTGDRTIER
jgi:hypothetical protein